MKDNDSLAHTTWNCKYHIVFAPKCRNIEDKLFMENIKQVLDKSLENYVKQKRNRKKIEQYIRDQLREDHLADQLTLFEEYDPFTAQKNPKKK